MKNPSTTTQILNIVRNIEKEQNRENRHDRIKSLEKDNQLLKGDNERLWESIRGIEKYLGVEFVKDYQYKKIK